MDNFFQIGIFGITGSGKSFLTTKIINQLKTSIIVIDDLNQIKTNFIIVNSLSNFLKIISEKKKFKLKINFENFQDYEILFKILWNMHNYILVIDEISLYNSVYNISEELRNIVQRGRLKNISLIYNSQRLANVNRNITTQTEFLISFKLVENTDLRYFNLTKNDKFKLMNLKKYEYMFIRGNSETLKERGIIL